MTRGSSFGAVWDRPRADEAPDREPELRRLVRRVREELPGRGPVGVLGEGLRVARSYAACRFLPSCRTPGMFTVGSRRLTYVRRPYNDSWRNERCVELSLARAFLASHPGRVLEVGNVMSHYFPVHHEVVDRYESGPGAHHVDVMHWCPSTGYDAIVTISTLEHVGHDESPRDSGKGLRALDHLRRLLVPETGRLLATVPFGHNPVLDSAIADDALGALAQGCFCRSRGLDWRESDAVTARACPYDWRHRSASAIFVGVWGALPEPGSSAPSPLPLDRVL